jgi:hypothetical protein
MTKLSFRASVPEDAGAIRALCREQLSIPDESPLFEPPLMEWKYWRSWPTWPLSRSYVIVRGAELLAHIAAMPVTYRRGSDAWTLLHPLDWAARPDVVGVGAMLLQRLSKLADGLLVVGGSALTQRMLGPFGFRPLPDVKRFAALPGVALPVGWELSALDASEAPASLDGVFSPGFVAARSPALLACWQQCPAIEMIARGVSCPGRPRGGFLLGLTPGQARIIDLWCGSADSADWSAVLVAARFEARRHAGVAEVVTLANTALEERALLDAGFEQRGVLPMFVQSRGIAALAEPHLRFQLLDGDAAFLHHGRVESWLGARA